MAEAEGGALGTAAKDAEEHERDDGREGLGRLPISGCSAAMTTATVTSWT